MSHLSHLDVSTVGLPLWHFEKPSTLPSKKVRTGSCSHSMYYLDPHVVCKKCNPLKCDFMEIKCDCCEDMQDWAYMLCHKRAQGNVRQAKLRAKQSMSTSVISLVGVQSPKTAKLIPFNNRSKNTGEVSSSQEEFPPLSPPAVMLQTTSDGSWSGDFADDALSTSSPKTLVVPAHVVPAESSPINGDHNRSSDADPDNSSRRDFRFTNENVASHSGKHNTPPTVHTSHVALPQGMPAGTPDMNENQHSSSHAPRHGMPTNQHQASLIDREEGHSNSRNTAQRHTNAKQRHGSSHPRHSSTNQRHMSPRHRRYSGQAHQRPQHTSSKRHIANRASQAQRLPDRDRISIKSNSHSTNERHLADRRSSRGTRDRTAHDSGAADNT